MDKLQQQEQDASIRAMGELLRTVSPPARTSEQWDSLARSVFSRVGDIKPKRRAWSFSLADFGRPLLNTPLFAGCAAAVAVLVISLSLYTRTLLQPAPLPLARVVDVQGDVRISETRSVPRDRSEYSAIDVPCRVKAHQTFRTQARSSLTLQLEQGCGLDVAPSTTLRIIRADVKEFCAFVEEGSILAKVTKRHPGQRFRIITPNAECTILGTIFKVDVTTDPQHAITTMLSVVEGSVAIDARASGRRTTVARGTSATLKNNAFVGRPGEVPEETVREGLALAAQLQQTAGATAGVLALSSQPSGADVFVNSRLAGKTPLTAEESPGHYRISIAYLNYAPWDSSVKVLEGCRSTVSVGLKGVAAASWTPAAPAGKPRCAVRPRTRPPHVKPKAADVRAPDRETVSRLPEYQAAQKEIETGDYQNALSHLTALTSVPTLSQADKEAVLENIVRCYRKTGDYTPALASLGDLMETVVDSVKKDNLLWETVLLKIDNLHDYEGAENDLVGYLVTFPNGIWIREAYRQLAEVQYLLGNAKAAAVTYERGLERFPDDPRADASLYALAHIVRTDLSDYASAVRWYTRLLKEFPASGYAENALFWKADCFFRLGRIREAQEGYRRYCAQFPDGRWKQAALSQLTTHK